MTFDLDRAALNLRRPPAADEGMSNYPRPAAVPESLDCPSIPGPSVHLRSIPTYV